MDQLVLENKFITEKLRQRDTDVDHMKARLAETERRQRDKSREADKLARENDEMRKQLESLTAISYRVDQNESLIGGIDAAPENQKHQENFRMVSEQLEKLKEQLVNTQNTSRQHQHSRQGSDLMSQSFNFQGNQIAQTKAFIGGYTTANSILGGNNLNNSGAVLNHQRERSRNQDELRISASSLSNYSSQQQTAIKTRQSMVLPGTTAKKQTPQ